MNMNAQFSQVYPGQAAAMVGCGNALMPMYHPLYHFHHHSQTMGLPAAAAHIYSPAAGPIPTVPALISKPTPMMAPTTGTYFDTGVITTVILLLVITKLIHPQSQSKVYLFLTDNYEIVNY